MNFIPTSRSEIKARGWDFFDFLLVSGDAYVDHPSFAPAVIGRVLESKGWRTAILPQPDWRSPEAFAALGRPRLAALVCAGNLDSMLNKLTASKKHRSTDAYSPGGVTGKRPDRATIVYCQRLRALWNDLPIITGGIEASLRRFAHYDYWSDSLRHPMLIDCQADLLCYGMGERSITEIANALELGIPVSAIRDVRGTCFISDSPDELDKFVELPSWEDVTDPSSGKRNFALQFKLIHDEQDPIRGKALVQRVGKRCMVQLPPAAPLSSDEMDEVYSLPYTRTWHPMYDGQGGVPALSEVKFSITSHRGCFGACAFCAIHEHQGRIIQARSHESIIKETELLTKLPDFHGTINDVGGPTANFRHPSCDAQLTRGTCRGRNCLDCKNLDTDHSDYIALLREVRAVKRVKHVFVRSGVRYDYLMLDKSRSGDAFLEELCRYHISGQLKVAPEHASEKVLRVMRKGGLSLYRKFMKAFAAMNKKLDKKQYLVPYFMCSHPGCGLNEAIELALFAKELDFMPEQAQDFIPTPGSLSTCIYYTGIDPLTGEDVYVPKSAAERKLQRALLQHRDPKNRELVREALTIAKRTELIDKLR